MNAELAGKETKTRQEFRSSSRVSIVIVDRPRFPLTRAWIERIPGIARIALVELGGDRSPQAGRTHVSTQET